MKKRNFSKLSVIFIGVIFTFTSIVFLSSIPTISNSYAKEKAVNIGEAEIKNLLLRPKGWTAEWHCDQWPGDWMTDLKFEAHGKKIVVKIYDPVNHFNCKRKIKITSDGFNMACCNTDSALLVFDPNDQMYPFKGENLSCIVKLKAK